MTGSAGQIADRAADPGVLSGELRVAIMHTSRRLRIEGSGDAVTPGQYSVLAALKSTSSTLRDLAERERVQPPAMTRTVAALVERGLVDRIEDPQDRRQILVSLTPAGRRVLSDARNQRNEWLARRLADLDPAERRLLAEATEILQRMSRM
jgi:DNA-binding MarR family transcriptional regulator